MKWHNKNLNQDRHIWNYRIDKLILINSKNPEFVIIAKREWIANFIGIKGYRIIKTTLYRGPNFINITYRTKRLSLLRRIKNVFL